MMTRSTVDWFGVEPMMLNNCPIRVSLRRSENSKGLLICRTNVAGTLTKGQSDELDSGHNRTCV